ncbi:MAG: hypothetical protein QOH88_1914 [Verrucomicrobiota bacterium]|jgi:hypothetical protein
MSKSILIAAAFCVICPLSLVAAEDDAENDSSAVLPKNYAGKYILATNTLSPDKTIGVIYPKANVCEDESNKSCKDFVVQVKPFKILGTLVTKSPYFRNRNHGAISGEWSKDGAAALITLESKWGPGDIFLVEFKGGQLTRATNLLGKIHDLLAPDYRKAMNVRSKEEVDFLFESEDSPMVEFKGSTIEVHAKATTDPKHIPGEKAWEGKLDAIWDIPAAKFTSQKVQRLFAGVRKDE